ARFKGAKLMHFDANQDIALLRLAEPVPESRPYLYCGKENAKAEDEVVIIGNPGRDGKFDPTYSRSGKVAGGRVDEFYLDLELKPGFSGGPVCMAASNQVLGLVSFKIVRSNDYEALGRSYAKAADLIGDAHDHFTSLSADSQQSRIDRLEKDHDEQYLLGLAGQAAVDMYLDSSVYLYICWTVAVDYIRYTAEVEAKMNPNLPLASKHRALKAAHGKYLKEEAPEIARKVRDRVSPKLRMAESKSYERAITNPRLDPDLKANLEAAYKNYSEIRQAAEQIVERSGSATKGRTIDEFLKWAAELYSEARENSIKVMVKAGVGIGDD
ncbi:MAG: trypsin-like peptidase domain-containing protein, partial [Planctomycetaceae bacterium]|nr:trypsin-like peptidase domain-containing protein [Planctomycetaceae bacterium]